MNRALAVLSIGILLGVAVSSCSAGAPGEGNPDFSSEDPNLVESESPEGDIDTSSEALTSSVSCDKTTMTAYQKGNAYSIEVITIGGKKISIETGHAFLQWQKAANKAGVTLKLVSGFRTNTEQKHLYGCYIQCNCNNCNPADPPGYSKHQSGHAIDVGTNNWSWVHSHAAQFGFTGISSEKWHFIFGGSDPGGPCD